MSLSELTYNQDFGNRVSSLVIDRYNKLPKTGKPNVNEYQWTLISGICLEEEDGRLSVVALATGTKCLGVNSYSVRGDVLHDSHAEVLTRRAWLRYLYSQMNLTLSGQPSRIFDQINDTGSVSSNSTTCSTHAAKLTSSEPADSTSKSGNRLKFRLKPGIKFHFYTSHTPCGDASIFPRKIKQKCLEKLQNQSKRLKLEKSMVKKTKDSDHSERVKDNLESTLGLDQSHQSENIDGSLFTSEHDCEVPAKKRKSNSEVPSKKFKPAASEVGLKDFLAKALVEHARTPGSEETEEVETSSDEDETQNEEMGKLVEDFHRTGAKNLPEASHQDPRGVGGPPYQHTGVVRTKPGRGDPTYSVSCSDKIAKWSVVGWEGGLISSLLLSPIQMSTIIVGGGVPFSHQALQRALHSRVANCILTPTPTLLHAQVEFPAGRRNMKRVMKKFGCPVSLARPAGGSVVWCDVDYKPLEVSIDGIRQGVSRKKHNLNNINSTLLVSSYKMLLQYIQLTKQEHYVNVPYAKIKQTSASEYLARMSKCKQALGRWLDVPEQFRQFCVQDINEKL
uniref:tRNA-specific adenosine deaminase 1 n=1 Tax=Cacopsylla melanoneura TaxID=428564 RepID=A0A8D8QK82_9HEMI